MPRAKKPKPAAPKVPRFSPTRIGLYLFCPRAYFLYYQRGLRWGGGTAGHALGGSVHRALQVFHERGGADELSQEELVGHLREKWSEQGFSSPEEAAAHLAAGEDLLLRYYESAAAA